MGSGLPSGRSQNLEISSIDALMEEASGHLTSLSIEPMLWSFRPACRTSRCRTPLLSHSDLAESNDRRYAIAMSIMEEQVAGSLLRSARLRLGLSQTAFAALLQVAQPTLSAYESGRRQPTLPTLLRMLGRAGLELRLELANRDNHDALLAEWEQTLTRQTRERLRAQGYRLVNDAA